MNPKGEAIEALKSNGYRLIDYVIDLNPCFFQTKTVNRLSWFIYGLSTLCFSNTFIGDVIISSIV